MALISINQNPTRDTNMNRFFYKYQVGNVKSELFIPVLMYHSLSKDGQELKYKAFTSNGDLWYNIRCNLRTIDGHLVEMYSVKYEKNFPTFRYISAPAKYFKDVKDWEFGKSPFKTLCMVELYYSEKDETKSRMEETVLVGENKGKTMFSCQRLFAAPTPQDQDDLVAEAEYRLAQCKEHYQAERDRVEPKETDDYNRPF